MEIVHFLKGNTAICNELKVVGPDQEEEIGFLIQKIQKSLQHLVYVSNYKTLILCLWYFYN